MTYFTYKKTQYSNYKKPRVIKSAGVLDDGNIQRSLKAADSHRYSRPPKRIPPTLPKPSFMPTYLVRTFDMKVVPGSEVHEGYCTLSYSWNQSGEIIEDETGKKNYRGLDEGKHKIVFPAKTVRKKTRGRQRISRKVKFVKFEGIIQEICKDFNIKYIWYDQMCINQNEAEEKHREIRQMHKIYSNAYCTVTLVPELEMSRNDLFDQYPMGSTIPQDPLTRSQWMKRIWTLEESIVSSKMLFIGCSVHCWWYKLPKYCYPNFSIQRDYNAATVLYYAHARTSSKKHDHVFALANVFPDIMNGITINYKQDIHKLLIQFYGRLAEEDLSILCFGRYTAGHYKTICETSFNNNTKNSLTKKAKNVLPILEFNLPSWTGVYGQHFLKKNFKTSFKNYTVNGRALLVTCSGMTNNQAHTKISALEPITLEDIPILSKKETEGNFSWKLVVRVRPKGSMADKLIWLQNCGKP